MHRLISRVTGRSHYSKRRMFRSDLTYRKHRLQAAADAELVRWLLSRDCRNWLAEHIPPFTRIDGVVICA